MNIFVYLCENYKNMKVKSLFLKCLVLAAFVFGLIAVAQSCSKKDSDLYDIAGGGSVSLNYAD